ncbi:hypothetical protein N9E20_00045 [Crocinitomicaceae bacterium]|jgi:hypothetical protein|nr:hypothetical protein [Crocinitomicaceae bacterium]
MKKKFLGLSLLAALVLISCDKKDVMKGTDFSTEVSTEEAQITLPTANFERRTTIAPISEGTDYYTSGRIEYQSNGEVLATVDYGDGTLDSEAIVTIENEETKINLDKKDCKVKGKKSDYKKVIVEPLVKSRDCDYIVSGIIKYYSLKTGKWTATVDFGDGTCDDIAVKIDEEGNTNTFTVSEYFK